MLSRGISQAAAEHFQLGFSGDTGDFKTANKLVIPYLTPAGPWFLKFRCLQPACLSADKCDGHPKYIYEDEGVDLHLYNAQALIGARVVAMVEGELDASVVQSSCGVPTVGVPGVDAWRANRHWRHLFDTAEEIVFVADGDVPKPAKPGGPDREPGRELGRLVTKDLRAAHPSTNVRMTVLPLGQNPDGSPRKTDSTSFICDRGVAAYRELVKL